MDDTETVTPTARGAAACGVAPPSDRTPLETRYRAAMTALGRVQVLAECLRSEHPGQGGLATIIEHELAALEHSLRMIGPLMDGAVEPQPSADARSFVGAA